MPVTKFLNRDSTTIRSSIHRHSGRAGVFASADSGFRHFTLSVVLFGLFAAVWCLTMAAATQENVQPFTRDFTQVIADHSLDVFVGHIRQVHATTDDRSGLGQRAGTFTVEVGEVLARHAVQPGSSITMAFHQDLHPAFMKRGGENPWNAVNITEGHAVLLACKSPDRGRTCQPMAALNADPPHTADVDAVRQSYRIEATNGQDKLELMGHALESQSPLLLSYAVNALAERNVLGHEQAVHLLSFALILTAVPPANREEIGRGLADLFDENGLSDANRTNILGALAHAMVDAKDKSKQAGWAALLRSCLMSKGVGDDARRYALVRNITVPPADRVIQTLTGLQHDTADEPDSEERALLARMAQIWQNAKR
jgi:hypothetical protein